MNQQSHNIIIQIISNHKMSKQIQIVSQLSLNMINNHLNNSSQILIASLLFHNTITVKNNNRK